MTYSLGSPPGGTLTAAGAASNDKFPIVDTSLGADDAANKTITVAEAKTLLAPSLSSTAPTKVQDKKSSSSRSATTISFTLDSSPTVGNGLWLMVTGFKDGALTAAPSGWTMLFSDITSVSNQFAQLLYREVQSGDTTSWSFTFPNTYPKNCSLVETSGVKNWTASIASRTVSAVQYSPQVQRALGTQLVFFAFEVDGTMTSASADANSTLLHSFIDATNHTGVLTQRTSAFAYSDSGLFVDGSVTWNTTPSSPICMAVAMAGAVTLA